MENNRFYVEGTALMFNGISVFTYKEKRTAKGACEHLNDSIAKEDPIDHQVGDLLFSIHVGTENISIGSKTGDVSEFEILGALEIIKEDIKDQYYRKREDEDYSEFIDFYKSGISNDRSFVFSTENILNENYSY